jgi:hypothetical protein
VAVRAKEKLLWAHEPTPLKRCILLYGIEYAESYRQVLEIYALTFIRVEGADDPIIPNLWTHVLTPADLHHRCVPYALTT